MKRLIIDPSSSVLGWTIMIDDRLFAVGEINTLKVEYHNKFPHIVEELRKVHGSNPDIREIAMEKAVRRQGTSIPALEVACKAIRDWAKTLRGVKFYEYAAATWKAKLLGNPRANKDEVRDYVTNPKIFPMLDIASEHIIDAVAIGLFHNRKMKIEGATR